jgi:hypothetical protein
MLSVRELLATRHELVSSGKRQLSYHLDRTLSFRVDPRDTLVISGFWRSGTSWLQQALAELLRAKILFEPCDPLVPDTREIHAYSQVSSKSFEFLRLYMPYCDSHTLANHPLHKFFDRALRAETRGGWVRRFRQNVTESFRSRVAVKFVRAQLCLRAAQNTFLMPVLHVYRDPRAIVASIRKTRWYWLFDHLWLHEQLLEPRDGRADFFAYWYEDILRYDREDPIARVTAYWALTEKFVQRCYAEADPQIRIAFVSYEELCQRREPMLLEILEKLAVCHIARGVSPGMDKDSPTTVEQRRGASVDERIAGWKKILTDTEVAQIETIALRFGFADRLVNNS